MLTHTNIKHALQFMFLASGLLLNGCAADLGDEGELDEEDGEGEVEMNSAALQRSENVKDADCVQAGGSAADCNLTLSTDESAAVPLSKEELAANADLQAADGTTLSRAAAARPIYARAWSQKYQSILWSETHKGRYFFDGYRVWIKPHRGTGWGYHDCDNGWAAGGTLQNLECSERGDYTAGMDFKDRWRAHGIAKGLPFSSTHWMNYHPNGNGTGTVTRGRG